MRNLVKGAGTHIWPALMLLLISLLIFTPRTPKAPGNNLLSTAPEENEVTDAPLRMLRAEFKKMMDPSTRDVPLFKLRAAEEEMIARLGNSRAASLTWTERGPSNIGGRTRALLVDASDGTGNKVFAGGIGGGLWVTTNFKNANPA